MEHRTPSSNSSKMGVFLDNLPVEDFCLFKLKDQQPGCAYSQDSQPVLDCLSAEHLLGWVLRRFQTNPVLCLKKFAAVASRSNANSQWFWPDVPSNDSRSKHDVPPGQKLPSVDNSDDTVCHNLGELYLEFIATLFAAGKVQELPSNEQSYYGTENFVEVPAKAAWVMKCFTIVLNHISNLQDMPSRSTVIGTVRVNGLYLCLEHLDNHHPWVSDLSSLMAEELLQCILKTQGCQNLDELLGSSSNKQSTLSVTLFGVLFTEMAVKLTKDKWQQNPSVVVVFSKCLLHIKFPHTSEHLDKLLPPTLLFIDEVHLHYKVLAVKCIHHIVRNVSASELCWYGRAQVVCNAMEHQLYTHEEPLLQVVLPSLLDILQVVDGPHRKSQCLRPTKSDEIFDRILTDMELEQKLVLRRVYAEHLIRYIAYMGILVTRHLKRLMTTIFSFLEIHDGREETSRMYALAMLRAVIIEAWPRMTGYCESILQSQLKFVCDVISGESCSPEGIRSNVLTKSVDCLVLLTNACPRKMVPLLMGLKTLDLNPICMDVVNKLDEHNELNKMK